MWETSEFKGNFYGPFNKREIEKEKEDWDACLDRYYSMYDEWDGVERNWRSNLWMLKEVEEDAIKTFVDDYMEKYIIGTETPSEWKKSEFHDAIACYVEMNIFPEEHYESVDRYNHPEADLVGIIDRFVDKAMPIIQQKGSKISSFTDLTKNDEILTPNIDSPDPLLSSPYPLVRFEKNGKAVWIGMFDSYSKETIIDITQEEVLESGEIMSHIDAYKCSDSNEYIHFSSRDQKTKRKEMEDGRISEVVDVTEMSANGTVNTTNSSIVHYIGGDRFVDSVLEEKTKVISTEPVVFSEEDESLIMGTSGEGKIDFSKIKIATENEKKDEHTYGE